MKSFGTVNLFDMLVNQLTPTYPAVVADVAKKALESAEKHGLNLIDEVTIYSAYHVDEYTALYILSASPNANAFLNEKPLNEESWRDVFQAITQYAMEADVHAWIKSREDETATEKVS